MTRKASYDYRYGTKQRVIATLVDRGMTRREIFAELKPSVLSQTPPMIFRRNDKETGKRVPLPIEKQLQRLWDQIGRVMSEMTGIEESREAMPESEIEPVEPAETETPAETEPEIETEPEAAGKESAEEYFLRRVDEIAAFCDRRAAIGETLDEIGNRPYKDGIRAIREGVSPDVMLHNMTMSWEDDVRREAGILPVDIEAESARLARKYNLPSEGMHKMAGLMVAFLRANVCVWLIGPAGSGKSFLARQAANYVTEDGLTYAECPMIAGATPSWLIGNVQLPTENNPDGFRPRPFLHQLENGGVFCFEELDAADANMVMVANQALALDAGEEFFNPANGEAYVKHELNRMCATGNTMGLGADRRFKGREGLDEATLDRFRMGRIVVDVDRDLAKWVARNQSEVTL